MLLFLIGAKIVNNRKPKEGGGGGGPNGGIHKTVKNKIKQG
jgi:hypothetical protein